jgi:23S rRNA pseudouridine1911/1915/1917 synthase
MVSKEQLQELEPLQGLIPPESAGLRLDQALARLYPRFSRSRLQQWIKQGRVSLNGIPPRPRDAVRGGERVVIIPHLEPQGKFVAEEIPLDMVYQDPHILVINKPPDLVVHPAAGNWEGTLLNALLHHAPELERLPRAGIVHRLDKDTSGLMVVARTLRAHKALVEQLQLRTVTREYLALVQGRLIAGGIVKGKLGRHPLHRKRMAVIDNGKPAVTHYRIELRFPDHTLLRIRLETGRTHQIRVHMAHIKHPIVGDPVYGGRLKLPAGAPKVMNQSLRDFHRQALHAVSLGLKHPQTGERMSWEVTMPVDMQQLIDVLKTDTQNHRE